VDEAQLPSDVERVDFDPDELGRADAVVLLADHDAFDLSEIALAPFVLDCRHRLSGPNVEQL
jgi:UDP-N-acetyl-D-glucosamine dehydrogenase